MTDTERSQPDLRELLAKATNAPWSTDGRQSGGDLFVYVYGPDGDQLAVVNANLALDTDPVADATLIVAAVNALPALLDELDRLRSRDGGISEEALTDALLTDGVLVYTTQSHDNAVTLLPRHTARNILAALVANEAESVPGEGGTK